VGLHYSANAEAVEARASDLSARWKHHYLSCEHYFLACCIEDSGCEGWLNDRGFSIEEFEESIIELVPLGDDKPIWSGVPKTPRIRRLLPKAAQLEAESERAHRIEPIHILRAIVSDGHCIPSRILSSGGPIEMPAQRDSEAQGTGALRGPLRGRPSGDEGAKDKKKPKSPNLDKYSRDIVQMVADGKVDPVIGRVDEVRRVLQILARKTKSNPVLIGEAGVGKTAVAFALARRIYDGKVPDALKGKRILELSLSSMVAGAKHRGEFEERLEGVTKEAMADRSVILFIDEIHQLVGAGDSRGGMDASNILKPALARGELVVLGATTTDEFRKYIEKDPALERRFQPVLVGEPSEEEALEMLKGIRKRFESHHGVSFTDDALAAAVTLGVRYLPDRNLPDKAIDLIDESAARVKTRSGVFHLDAQGRPSMSVDEHVVAEVVADWTGIPVQRMSEQESTRLLKMESELTGRVVGQDHAVTAVAQAIRVVRVGLVAPNRPGGVFLFMGPSGVGKTELGKALADFLFGDPNEMVRLDMSEYHDKSSINRLIGSPPGYVGHDEEGQLTKAVRTKPYSVVLLDEVEKAHPEIFDLFLQVFDDGRLTDSKGRTVNFTNTIIVMTSNLGARELLEAGLPNEGYAGQLDSLPQQYQKALRSHFRPEFLNRVDEIIAFRALEREDLYGIAKIHLGNLQRNLLKSRGVTLEVTQDALELLLEFGYQPQFGARPLQRAIATHLSRPLAEEMLRSAPQDGDVLIARREGDKLVFTPNLGTSVPSTQATYAGDELAREATVPRSPGPSIEDFHQPPDPFDGHLGTSVSPPPSERETVDGYDAVPDNDPDLTPTAGPGRVRPPQHPSNSWQPEEPNPWKDPPRQAPERWDPPPSQAPETWRTRPGRAEPPSSEPPSSEEKRRFSPLRSPKKRDEP
jgi:ATP-dependent Clp protease ATP-binding subunit ClpC